MISASFARQTRPHAVLQQPPLPGLPWAEQAASHRIGVTVEAGER